MIVKLSEAVGHWDEEKAEELVDVIISRKIEDIDTDPYVPPRGELEQMRHELDSVKRILARTIDRLCDKGELKVEDIAFILD